MKGRKRAISGCPGIIMQVRGWKTRSMFLRYAMTGRDTLQASMAKLGTFDRRERGEREAFLRAEKGARSRKSASMIKQKTIMSAELMRAGLGTKNKLQISYNRTPRGNLGGAKAAGKPI